VTAAAIQNMVQVESCPRVVKGGRLIISQIAEHYSRRLPSGMLGALGWWSGKGVRVVRLTCSLAQQRCQLQHALIHGQNKPGLRRCYRKLGFQDSENQLIGRREVTVINAKPSCLAAMFRGVQEGFIYFFLLVRNWE